MKIVILYSGGLDSLILKHFAEIKYPAAEVKCLYYKHGAESEVEEVKRLPSYVDVRTVDWLGDTIRPQIKKDDPYAGAIYIPGRNLIFSALAACQELADEVWMGTLWDEDNDKGTDKNERFRKDTSDLLSYVLGPFVNSVKVRFPFVENEWTKRDSVKWALENGLTKTELVNTVSCWNHKGVPCGECKQCFKRHLVFKLNGIDEECAVHPLFSRHGTDLLLRYVSSYEESKASLNRDELNVIKMIMDMIKTGLMPQPIIDRIDSHYPHFLQGLNT